MWHSPPWFSKSFRPPWALVPMAGGAPAPSRPQYTPSDLERWARTTGTRTYFAVPPRPVALTFDDGPYPEETPKVLAVLKRYGVRATFFMLGKQVARYPQIARQVAEAGHDIGNHSYDHQDYTSLSPEAVRADMERCKEAIREATGIFQPIFQPIFRTPGGLFDEKTLRVAADLGYRFNLHWTVHSHDDRQGVTPDEVLVNATTNLHPGYVVIFHDWSAASGEALPRYLDWLKEQNFQPVSVTELLYVGNQMPEAAAPPPR